MIKLNPTLSVDAYKLGHRAQYPKEMTSMYSNLTPRSSKHFSLKADGFDDKVVVFGIKALVTKLQEEWQTNFFEADINDITSEYTNVLKGMLGLAEVDVSMWKELHELGYLPISIKALDEGTRSPIKTPIFTITNTHDNFAWLVNYLETYLSSNIWKPITMATSAYEYKRTLSKYNKLTADTADFMPWQVHDFAARGLGSSNEWSTSSIAHLTCFNGTDTVQAVLGAKYYYDADVSCGNSVMATEHSSMTININTIGGDKLEAEKQYLTKLLTEIAPTGIVSVVSDSYDFWGVIEHNLPALKDVITSREGKLVIRPDSGLPIDVICGDLEAGTKYERLGLLRALWNIFGGITNSKGYKVLDPHIGIIYGDAIPPNKYEAILARMETMGFSSDNLVVGAGAYAQQMITRDTLGFAIKATHCIVGGKSIDVSKEPKTDSGKRSAKGLIKVNNDLSYKDQCTVEEEAEGLLKPVYKDGKVLTTVTLEEIRARLNS